MEALEILGYIIVVLSLSGMAYLFTKIMVSFARKDEKERKIFNEKHNQNVQNN